MTIDKDKVRDMMLELATLLEQCRAHCFFVVGDVDSAEFQLVVTGGPREVYADASLALRSFAAWMMSPESKKPRGPVTLN